MEFRYLSVRFMTSCKTYTFKTTDTTIVKNDYVIVETQRGLELAKVVFDPTSEPNINLEIKEIVRKGHESDYEKYLSNKDAAIEAKNIAQAEADKLNLGMNIIASEYTLDRAKVTFTYLADDRVDFRELLKVLAGLFHCRIDLRQIGTRDKAKMVSGIGTCGRELCCAKFLNDFDRVSINMAKNQLLALNIQKLSGQCGNLMCCLRYEDEAYKELRKGLPKMNSMIEYDGVKYRLTSMNVINKTCKLENRESAQYITLEELMKKGKVVTNTQPQNHKKESVEHE